MLEMIPEEMFCPASYPNYTYIGRRLIEGNGHWVLSNILRKILF